MDLQSFPRILTNRKCKKHKLKKLLQKKKLKRYYACKYYNLASRDFQAKWKQIKVGFKELGFLFINVSLVLEKIGPKLRRRFKSDHILTLKWINIKAYSKQSIWNQICDSEVCAPTHSAFEELKSKFSQSTLTEYDKFRTSNVVRS